MNAGVLTSFVILLSCSIQPCCPSASLSQGACIASSTTNELLQTILEIHCMPDDIIEVEGYRLQSNGSIRLVQWWLKPGIYSVTVTRVTNSERQSKEVQFAAGTTCQVQFNDCVIRDNITNYGLDPSKLGKNDEITGTLTREDIQRYIAATRNKLRATIIVPDSQVEAVRAGATSLNDIAIVQVYPPGHWALERAGIIVENNQPTVIVQDASGKVLAKTKYENINQVRELIEQCSRTPPSQQPLIKQIPWWGWLIIVYLIYYLLLKKKERSDR